MRFRSRQPFLIELFLQAKYELTVLGMHGRYCAELKRTREAIHEYFVVRHDSAFIRHEMLETVNTVITHQCFHVAIHAVVPPGDGHVEAVIRDRFFGPFAPLLVGFENILLRIRNNEVDDHRCATGQPSRGARFKVFACHGAHEGQLHVRVWIDAAGHDELAAGVYDRRAARHIDVSADSRNDPVFANDICAK